MAYLNFSSVTTRINLSLYTSRFSNLSLSDQFHQNAFEKITEESSKLRNYSTYKEKIGLEPYLNHIKNPAVRTEISKFRLSNHKLMIEIGRHKKIPKHLRFCQFCPNEVETEKNFLLHCSTYKEIRKKMITDAGLKNPCFRQYWENQKFQYLLSNVEKHTSAYIINAFEIREFLKSPCLNFIHIVLWLMLRYLNSW